MKQKNVTDENSSKSSNVIPGDNKRKANIYPKDLTVEQYLNQHCEQIIENLQNHAKGLVEQLKEEHGELKQRLLSDEAKKKTDNKEGDSNGEGVPSEMTIQLMVQDGPYKGRKFDIKVKYDKPSMVGRSRGVKFRHGGISLPRDGEVSTTHGKFELRSVDIDVDNAPFGVAFTDAGSTNGTFLNGEQIEANDAHILKVDDSLQVGSTILKVHAIS